MVPNSDGHHSEVDRERRFSAIPSEVQGLGYLVVVLIGDIGERLAA